MPSGLNVFDIYVTALINTVHFLSLLFSFLPAKENVIKSQFPPLEDRSFHTQQPAM